MHEAKVSYKKKSLLLLFFLLVLAVSAGVAWRVKPEWFYPPEPLTLAVDEPIWGQLRVEGSGAITIGTPIRITLEVETKPAVGCDLPDFGGTLPDTLEMLRKLPVQIQRLPGGLRQKEQYDIVAWESGKIALPSLKIPYREKPGGEREYLIPGRLIAVESVLPPSKSDAELMVLPIKGPKQPVALPPRYEILALYLLIVLAVIGGALGTQFVRARRASRSILKQEEAGPEPADIIALRELEVLKQAHYPENTNFQIFYTKLSECLRRYMEGRYRIMALEMTTEEFLKHLTRGDWLNREQQEIVRDLLVISDRVKFAKDCPTRDEALQALGDVEQLIASTRENEAVLNTD